MRSSSFPAAIGFVAFTAAVPALTGCLTDLLHNGDADAGAASDAGSASSTQPDAAVGAGCTGDLGGGLKLCTYVSICPTVGVDHDVYPNCGFRLRGDVLDLECVCDGVLCPIGVPATCEQAKELLASQTELAVCAQVNEGRCTTIGAGTGTTTPPSCDRNCSAQCHGDESCIASCGC